MTKINSVVLQILQPAFTHQWRHLRTALILWVSSLITIRKRMLFLTLAKCKKRTRRETQDLMKNQDFLEKYRISCKIWQSVILRLIRKTSWMSLIWTKFCTISRIWMLKTRQVTSLTMRTSWRFMSIRRKSQESSNLIKSICQVKKKAQMILWKILMNLMKNLL